MCNIRDAITFKNVDNNVIDNIENFVRTDVPAILTKWKMSGNHNSINDAEYFGEVYASDHKSFRFVVGDRILILEMAKYVKKVIEEAAEDGLQYFSAKDCHTTNTREEEPKLLQYDDEYSPKEQYLLHKLVLTSNQNIGREKGGYRYDYELQNFAIAIRLLSGQLAYETLQINLPCALPSLPSVNRYINKSNCRVIECVLRCNELLEYLKERGLEKVVHLSEDATRIVGRVQYDSYTNQIAGFVSPLNCVGLPIPFAFPARNAREMVGHFEQKNEISSLVNVIMAKPVGTKSTPAFCLLLFGTDNKYTAEDVANRWNFIVDQLKELGIKVVSISSDSDPRYNAAMKNLSKLGNTSEKWPGLVWFNCGQIDDFDEFSPVCYQDVPHIMTKMRNLITKTKNCPKKLPFGKFFIQQSHLRKIIACFSKDVHNLSPMVLDPCDRQNYDSAVRICNEKVTELLRGQPESEGTRIFLQIMRNINDSFMDVSLAPLERVYKIWYSVFVLRLWREFLNSKRNLSLKKNFLSLNCYTCVELNAHGLLVSMFQFKNQNSPHLFQPTLFNSQHCESLFRQIRSISSTFSTVTNCTIKEISQRISKIQLQSDIMSRFGSKFEFPRLNRLNKCEELKVYDLPELHEIYAQVEKSKQDATRDAIELGLIQKKNVNKFDFACKIIPYSKKRQQRQTVNGNKSNWMSRTLDLNKINLKNYAKKFIGKDVEETSPFVEIRNYSTQSLERKIYKKTMFCWLLRGDYDRVSSDRLERVKIAAKKKKTFCSLRSRTVKKRQTKRNSKR